MRAFRFGEGAPLQQPFVDAGIFGVALVLGAELVVPAVQLLDLIVDAVEGGDVGVHLLLGDFVQVFLFEQPLQFFLQGDELRVLLIEVAGQGLAGLAQGVFEFVGQHQLFFLDLGEHEQHVFQGDIQEIGGVGAVFDALLEVQEIQVVAGFPVELVELLEIEMLQEFVTALEADQVIEAAGIGQGLFQGQDSGAVLNLADLLGENLRHFRYRS